jgi:alkylation response protein AidB-like acyl-CoA dehydrogenase
MDFSYGPEAEAFRAELRAWIEANLDPALRGGPNLELDASRLPRLREWNHRLADAGYAALAWPREHGGREASVIEQLVYLEEMSRAGAPGPLNAIGLPNIAPAIMTWGTPQQKQRFLGPMLRGDEIWCQGFSEPEAGSDLAGLRTRAVLEGSAFVVTGQKTWNTLGPYADWCELLVRTDPDAPRHAGISCLLVDMHLPGVSVRPLRTIAGTHEFSELFFDAVRVPRDALLGPLNAGWKVAMTTLSHERAGVASLHLGVRRKIARLIETARRTPRGAGCAADDPLVRQQLARCYALGEHMKALADRAISSAIHGRPPGPEGSLVKLTWSELENEIADAAGLVLGAEANAGEWGHERVFVRSTSIAGGTTQVNKNILAQRVLGLPRST